MFILLPCLSVEICLQREQSTYFSLLFTESVPMARRTLAGTRPLHHPSIASLVQQPPHQTPNWLTGRHRSAFHSSCRTLCGYGGWTITHPLCESPVWTNVQIPQFIHPDNVITFALPLWRVDLRWEACWLHPTDSIRSLWLQRERGGAWKEKNVCRESKEKRGTALSESRLTNQTKRCKTSCQREYIISLLCPEGSFTAH